MTTTYLGPCGVGDCPNNATRDTDAHGLLCDTHRRRLQPNRAGGTALSEPVHERKTPRAKLLDAALDLAEADSDLDYARAEGRLEEMAELLAESKRAVVRLNKAAEAYGSELLAERDRQLREKQKAGMAKAKAEGRWSGRVPKLDQRAAAHAVNEAGGVRAAAQALGVSESTIKRALKRAPRTLSDVSTHGALHGPLLKRDSEES